MPISKHFGGKGEKVADAMKKEYGKNWERVFYATENKQKQEKAPAKRSPIARPSR